MIDNITTLITSYENGTLTRRHLIQALALMATPATASAQATVDSVTKARTLHHVNIRVSDLARSEAFYRKLFGLPASHPVIGPDNHGFDLPSGSLIILEKSDSPGRIDHFCVGVERFDADKTRSAVAAAGNEIVPARVKDTFYVLDPDGVRVQFSAVDWNPSLR